MIEEFDDAWKEFVAKNKLALPTRTRQAGQCLTSSERSIDCIEYKPPGRIMSNDRMDMCYSIRKGNGAIGAELIGPDGVGFMLFYHEERKNELGKALVKERLEEYRFRFDFSGGGIISMSKVYQPIHKQQKTK
jgi:hypothetical protein